MNSDAIKHQKQALFNSKVGGLKERSKQNPYLTDVIKQYDLLSENKTKTQQNLVDALQIIKAHLEFLKKKHGDDYDLINKLENDLANVQNKLDKYNKNEI